MCVCVCVYFVWKDSKVKMETILSVVVLCCKWAVKIDRTYKDSQKLLG